MRVLYRGSLLRIIMACLVAAVAVLSTVPTIMAAPEGGLNNAIASLEQTINTFRAEGQQMLGGVAPSAVGQQSSEIAAAATAYNTTLANLENRVNQLRSISENTADVGTSTVQMLALINAGTADLEQGLNSMMDKVGQAYSSSGIQGGNASTGSTVAFNKTEQAAKFADNIKQLKEAKSSALKTILKIVDEEEQANKDSGQQTLSDKTQALLAQWMQADPSSVQEFAKLKGIDVTNLTPGDLVQAIQGEVQKVDTQLQMLAVEGSRYVATLLQNSGSSNDTEQLQSQSQTRGHSQDQSQSSGNTQGQGGEQGQSQGQNQSQTQNTNGGSQSSGNGIGGQQDPSGSSFLNMNDLTGLGGANLGPLGSAGSTGGSIGGNLSGDFTGSTGTGGGIGTGTGTGSSTQVADEVREFFSGTTGTPPTTPDSGGDSSASSILSNKLATYKIVDVYFDNSSSTKYILAYKRNISNSYITNGRQRFYSSDMYVLTLTGNTLTEPQSFASGVYFGGTMGASTGDTSATLRDAGTLIKGDDGHVHVFINYKPSSSSGIPLEMGGSLYKLSSSDTATVLAQSALPYSSDWGWNPFFKGNTVYHSSSGLGGMYFTTTLGGTDTNANPTNIAYFSALQVAYMQFHSPESLPFYYPLGSYYNGADKLAVPSNSAIYQARLSGQSTQVTIGQYDYMSWGRWNDPSALNMPAISNNSLWINGTMTPADQIPRNGTASYSGSILGAYHSGATHQDLSGTVNFTSVDFANRTLQGGFTFNNGSGGTINGAWVAGTNCITGSIKATSGEFAQNNMAGAVNGAFFGNNVQHIGGAWNMQNQDWSKTANGVFAATKDN